MKKLSIEYGRVCAMTWDSLLELMKAEPEGHSYANDWDLSKPAEELMKEYE